MPDFTSSILDSLTSTSTTEATTSADGWKVTWGSGTTIPSSTSVTDTSTVNSEATRAKAKETYEALGSKTNVFLSSVRTYVAGVLMPTIAVSVTAAFGANPVATVSLPADPRLFNVGIYDRVPVHIFVKETVAESPNYILMFEGFVKSRDYTSLPSQREITLSCVAFTQVFEDTQLKFMTSIDEVFMSKVVGESCISQNVFVPGSFFPECLFMNGLSLQTETNGGTRKFITCPTEYLANIIQFMEEAGTNHAPAGRYNDSIVSKYFATLAYNLRMDKRFCWIPYFDYAVSAEEEKKDSETAATTDSTNKTTTDATAAAATVVATTAGTSTSTETTSESKSSAYTTSSNTLTEKAAWEVEKIEKQGGDECTMFPVLYGLKTDAIMMALQGAYQSATKEFSLAELINFLVEQMEYEFLIIANPAYNSKPTGEDLGAKIDSGRDTTLDKDKMTGKGKRDAPSPMDGVEEKTAKENIKNLQEKYKRERNCDRMVNFCVKPMLDDTFPPKCNVIFRSQVLSIQASQEHYGVPTRIQVSNFNPFFTSQQFQGTANAVLGMYGSVDFYPSNYFSKDMTGDLEKGRSMMSETLNENEMHTGPWVVRHNAPNWVQYAFTKQTAPDKDLTEQIKKMREQYMRRQLMRARILERQLTAECVFLPYITCGFPAVVYDSSDSGFSFAGNVIAYEHQLSPVGMTTTVTLNGVRLLAEAAIAEHDGEYPNPINSVHKVTHNVKALTRIYAAILGTPGSDISGATPMTWEEVKTEYSGIVTDVTTSPQTNIYEAYKLQRRNIITQDDYCSFMGLTQTPSGTDESGNPPTEITNTWMADRADIAVYQVIPLEQLIKPGEFDKKTVDEQKKDKQEELDKVNTQITDTTNEMNTYKSEIAECDAVLADEKASASDKSAAQGKKTDRERKYSECESKLSTLNGQKADLETEMKSLTAEEEKIKEAEEKSKEKLQGFTSDGEKTNLITILKQVAEEERSHNIY